MRKVTNDMVYNTNRVQIPASRDGPMQTSLIPGVSANSWLTPLGTAAKTTGTVSYVSNPGGSLGINSKMRAKSASAIMGRRHFEVDKQDVGKNEYVQGIQIKSCISTRINTPILSKSSNSQSGKTQANVKDVEKKYRLSQRPKTSPAGSVTGLVRDPNEIQVDVLIIRSLSITTSAKNDNREKLDINGDNNDFKNIKEMKSAYEQRIKSAPARKSSSAKNEKQSKEFEKRAGTPTPWYLRTKSSHNRTQNLSFENEEKQTTSNIRQRLRGSFLRSLLQRSSDLRHSVDCPYKCRGCFKACLASEKFVDYYLGKKMSDSPSISNAYSRKEHKTSKCFKQHDYHKYFLDKALGCSQSVYKKLVAEKDSSLRITQSTIGPIEGKQTKI